jgi:hypothetical protein
MTQMLELTIEDNLFAQLQQKAAADGADISTVAKRALRQYLQDEAQQKMHQEIDAYHRMHVTLREQYMGQYVAIHQGQVVDHDIDQHALYLRIRQRFPDDVLLIRQVRAEPEKTWTIRTPRFERE